MVTMTGSVMTVLKFLLTLLVCFPRVSCMNIVSSSPTSGSLMTLGSQVRLSCSSDSPWFFCLWHSPDGGKQCAIQESSPTSVCTSSPQLVLWGTTRTCGVTIHSITKQDHGNWVCLLSDIREFDSRKQFINLQVVILLSRQTILKIR